MRGSPCVPRTPNGSPTLLRRMAHSRAQHRAPQHTAPSRLQPPSPMNDRRLDLLEFSEAIVAGGFKRLGGAVQSASQNEI